MRAKKRANPELPLLALFDEGIDSYEQAFRATFAQAPECGLGNDALQRFFLADATIQTVEANEKAKKENQVLFQLLEKQRARQIDIQTSLTTLETSLKEKETKKGEEATRLQGLTASLNRILKEIKANKALLQRGTKAFTGNRTKSWRKRRRLPKSGNFLTATDLKYLLRGQ